MAEKSAWLWKRGETLRRTLMLEPRGHAGMHGALFTEPISRGAHAGLLFMNAAGFPAISGEAVLAAASFAVAHTIIHTDSDELSIDTPAGLLTVRPQRFGPDGDIPSETAALSGLPGFVHAAGLPVPFGSRTVAVDIAFGGEFYAIVDSEAVGIPIDTDHGPELIRAAARLLPAVDEPLAIALPGSGAMHGAV